VKWTFGDESLEGHVISDGLKVTSTVIGRRASCDLNLCVLIGRRLEIGGNEWLGP
jgi:hypothetical protein